MKGLTKKQREVLDFIQEFINANRYAPSYREIGERFGLSSLASVYRHIQALKKKGAIDTENKLPRSMEITSPSLETKAELSVEIPYIGNISADSLIQTFSNTQIITVPKTYVNSAESTYALKIQGNTFSEDMIAEGDMLLVEARQQVNPGETVIALINGTDVIIKKYYPEGEYVRLLGNYAQYHPMIIKMEDIEIKGVVTTLLRHFG